MALALVRGSRAVPAARFPHHARCAQAGRRSELDLVMTRDQRKLIAEVARGKVYESAGRYAMRRTPGGQNGRCDARIRELVEAGLVELGPSAVYILTTAGEAEMEGSR